MIENITTIAFDADDTLWENEQFFRNTERVYCDLLKNYLPKDKIMEILFAIEVKNLSITGFGTNSFVLSMIEALSEITNDKAPYSLVKEILKLGIKQMNMPVTLLPDIEKILKALKGKYNIVLATKGDLIEQNRKIKKSGLAIFFDHIEVMEDKTEENYLTMLKTINCKPENLLMIGNSMKSDIIPILNLGGTAIHIPYHTTWTHEVAEEPTNNNKLIKLNRLSDILKIKGLNFNTQL